MMYQKVSLAQITNNLDSQRVPLNDAQRKVIEGNGSYPYVGANNILGYVDEYIFDEKILCIAEDGGSWGQNQRCSFIMDEKCWVNNHAHVLTAKEGSSLEYLCHYLNYSDLTNSITGTTRGKLTKSALNNIQIPLPPLAEQQRIAAILDAADAHRQKTKALLEKYDQLAQSIFLEMFGDPVTNERGWEVKKLGKICGVGSSRRVFVENLVAQGVPFFRGTEVGQLGDGREITPSLFISEEHYERLKEQEGVPEIGDLLMPSICPDGRIWRVSNSDPFYFKDGRVLWIKVDGNRISSSYLRAFLKAIFAVNYEKIASGTTFAELKIVALKGIAVSIPPIELQNQFEARISQVEMAKRNTQEAFNKSESLFQSLLQGAFSGK